MKCSIVLSSLLVCASAFARTSVPNGFTDNLDAALKAATAENKYVYVCFSGSDWCHWCQKLDKEVFADESFTRDLKDEYLFVFVDLPNDKSLLSEYAKEHNKPLADKYSIKGLPTALVLDSSGAVVHKTGYRKGGAAEYVKFLKEVRKMKAMPANSETIKPAPIIPPKPEVKGAADFKAVRIEHNGTNLESRLHPTYTSLYNGSNSTARLVPAHLGKSVIYQLFPRMFTPEGTFAAAAEKLPQLKALGVDIIYLTPHQLADDDPDEKYWSARQKASGCKNPKNPYRQKDFFAVDPEYGPRIDLQKFIFKAHGLGMKVWFDIVYFHCGPNAVFLKEHPEYIVRNPDGTPKLGDWAFPEMDISKNEVREYLWSNMTFLVKTYGIDGFRCDVGDMLPVDFWEEGYRRCKPLKAGFTMMCEGLRADDQLGAFDLAYGFYTQWTLVEFLSGTEKASLLEYAWRKEKRDFPENSHWMRCFENHDFANAAPGEKRKEELYGEKRNEAMLATLFLLDGVPMIYNGQEIADSSRHSIFSDRDHGALGIDWTREKDEKAVRRFAKVQEFTKLRHDYPSLFNCPLVWNKTDDPDRKFSFTRMLAEGGTITLTVDIVSGDYNIERN